MGSFIFLALPVPEIYALSEKTSVYLRENFPLMKFQKVGTKSLITYISKLVFKYLCCNTS